jgi:hypothetical protein
MLEVSYKACQRTKWHSTNSLQFPPSPTPCSIRISNAAIITFLICSKSKIGRLTILKKCWLMLRPSSNSMLLNLSIFLTFLYFHLSHLTYLSLLSHLALSPLSPPLSLTSLTSLTSLHLSLTLHSPLTFRFDEDHTYTLPSIPGSSFFQNEVDLRETETQRRSGDRRIPILQVLNALYQR